MINAIPKDVFVSAIEAIRTHMHNDSQRQKLSASDDDFSHPILKSYARTLSSPFLTVDMDDDYCPVGFYCFQVNFGRVSEDDIIEPDEFYEMLQRGDYL